MAKRILTAAAVVGALLLTAAAVWWIWLRPSTALTAPEGGARTCGPAGAPPESLKMFATQIITNSGDDSVEITAVTFPTTSGAEVKDWFLVGLDEYMYATGASPDIPPAPAGSEPTLQPGETKRVAVVLKVTADHTTEDHLTIDYLEGSGREGTLTPARTLWPRPHGQAC